MIHLLFTLKLNVKKIKKTPLELFSAYLRGQMRTSAQVLIVPSVGKRQNFQRLFHSFKDSILTILVT